MSLNEEPEEQSRDSFPNGGLFDPGQTLPYTWGDDPGMTLPYLFGGQDSFSLLEDVDLVEGSSDLSNIPSGDSNPDPDEQLAGNILSEPQTTRAGRKTKLPAKYRDMLSSILVLSFR